MVMQGDLTWGGEHTIQCTDDVLWNCIPETRVVLFTSVTPINRIKEKKPQKYSDSLAKVTSFATVCRLSSCL